MMFRKGVTSTLSLLMAVAAVVLMSPSLVRQAWLVNAWSVQYTRHAFVPAAKQSVLAIPPTGHARAVFWLASDALQSGNPGLAETLIASQAVRGDQFALHLMAGARLAEGNFAGAVAIWQQAGDLDSLLRAAAQAQQAGHLEEALMAYAAGWKLDSEAGTLPLANFLLNYRQDYGGAENVLRQSLAAFPNSWYWPAWSRCLGDVLRDQKRWDEAATAYENTIVKTPDDWAAHIGLGWARYEHGDSLQAAISAFQEAIHIPESQGNGQLAIAQVLTREKQYEEADAWYVQALALNPSAQWWYVYRGDAAWQAGNLALALAVYQETVARFPEFGFAYYQIAYACQLNGQTAQAIAAIDRALALMAPPNADYYVRAGSIYEWAGDKSRALHAYRQALLIDPQNAAAFENVQRLDK